MGLTGHSTVRPTPDLKQGEEDAEDWASGVWCNDLLMVTLDMVALDSSAAS